MKARLYINGRLLGELTYEHPKNPDGSTHLLPRTDVDDPGTVEVIIEADTRECTPFWHGKSKLTRLGG